MMTRKDFEAAAKRLREMRASLYLYRCSDALVAKLQAEEDLYVATFAASNPRFDEDRFRDACNPKEMDHASSQ
jgi:hypothetical protein